MLIYRFFLDNGDMVFAFKEFSGQLGLLLNTGCHFDR